MTSVAPPDTAHAPAHTSYGMATMAEPRYLDDGRLTFVAPPGAYAALPAWHSALAWLGAAKLHPRLAAACQGRIAVPTFLAVLRVLANYADVATGRDIAVAHATLAAQVGRCDKTIQRACRVAESLGLLVRVLQGADMSLDQRVTVLGHYSRRTRGSKWRALPNFYAAVMPASLAALAPPPRARRSACSKRCATFVEDGGPHVVHTRSAAGCDVHLPVGSRPSLETRLPLCSSRTTFDQRCGQLSTPSEQQDRPAGARPTRARRRMDSASPARRFDPAVEGFAEALQARLAGYRGVSLHRICPCLQAYVAAGLSPSDLVQGLNSYLAAVRRTWLTSWAPTEQEQQARYLIGMLKRARQAGYIRLPAAMTRETSDRCGDLYSTRPANHAPLAETMHSDRAGRIGSGRGVPDLRDRDAPPALPHRTLVGSCPQRC